MKYVDHLSQESDTGKQRYLAAGEPIRLSAPVPMLVQSKDPLGYAFRESHLSSDLGAALATRLDEFGGVLSTVLQNIQDAAKSLGKARLHAGVADDEPEDLGETAVNQLEVAFEIQIIREIEFADARGIAATPEILQQERVIEITQLNVIEADFAADMHADVTAPDAMPLRLPLGHIERFAQSLDDFRQADLNARHKLDLVDSRTLVEEGCRRIEQPTSAQK
jgi:hypothetical protein